MFIYVSEKEMSHLNKSTSTSLLKTKFPKDTFNNKPNH